MPRKLIRIVAAGLLAILGSAAPASVSFADEATPPAPSASPSAPVSGAPAAAPGAQAQPPAETSPPQPPAGAGPAPAPPPDAANPADSGKGKAEMGSGETVDFAQHPFAFVEGKADKDEVYGAIQKALATVRAEMDKAGAKAAGKPIAVFLDSDDAGFHFRAGYPIEAAPDGKTALSDAVKIGVTPSGKAMRFQHQGAYSDIDGTYDAITAYLDEKGIDAQDSFVEEYLNDVKDADDPNLEVNIYVLLK